MSDEVKPNGELVSLYAQRNSAMRSGGNVKALNAEINAFVKENNISTEVRRASSVAASNVQSNSRGADVKPKKKKKVPVIAISVGMAEMPSNKKQTKMMYGGMANGKKHNYAVGGSVSDNMNKGLRALQKEAPDVVAKMLGK
jgi:hypothetical protein